MTSRIELKLMNYLHFNLVEKKINIWVIQLLLFLLIGFQISNLYALKYQNTLYFCYLKKFWIGILQAVWNREWRVFNYRTLGLNPGSSISTGMTVRKWHKPWKCVSISKPLRVEEIKGNVQWSTWHHGSCHKVNAENICQPQLVCLFKCADLILTF